MRSSRELSEPVLAMIRSFPRDAHPMELLQSVVSYLSGYVQHRIHHSPTCNCRDTLHQVVQLASVVAAWQRFREGRDYVPPRQDLSHGANFLYMLRGSVPEDYEGRIMDTALVLHAEHGFNASTFTARVVASTMSTCYCSISAAIGALYGTLHGGANERVMKAVEEIGSPQNVKKFLDTELERAHKIMGMGHRIYKSTDPRAVVMQGFLEELSRRKNDRRYLEILKELERDFRSRMEEKGKPCTRTWTSSQGRCTPCWTSRPSCSRRSSPWPGWPAGWRTSWSSAGTTSCTAPPACTRERPSGTTCPSQKGRSGGFRTWRRGGRLRKNQQRIFDSRRPRC
jgi:citrate synthase